MAISDCKQITERIFTQITIVRVVVDVLSIFRFETDRVGTRKQQSTINTVCAVIRQE